ncbi:MAG: hypothetical protein J6U53_06245 [Tidjanibacter sp.]|nr:hypothetical protein [Tidjanibacter sp.]
MKIMHIYNKVWLALTLLFVGCQSVEGPVVALNNGEVEHTLVMYLIANNNLDVSIYRNALDAERGMDRALPSTRLVIYLDRRNETKLYEVRYLPYGNGGEYIRSCKVLKEYPQQISTTPEVMSSVLEDVKRLAPSRSYGLVLSGHGTGWFPKPSSGTTYDNQRVSSIAGEMEYSFNYERFMPETRAMGYDSVMQEDGSFAITDESYISASEIVEGLSPIHFDYILFDACFMSSIEFLYDLRHSADYVMASPVEILGVGLPYVEIVGNLLSTDHDLVELCDLIMDVYMRDNQFTVTKSLALALMDCSQFEALAEVVAEVYESVKSEDYRTTIANRIDMSEMQVLDRMSPAAFHDFEDYVCALAGEGKLREKFLEALSRVVVKSVHTEDIYSYGYSPDGWSKGYDYIENKVGGVLDLCGINTYIPYRDVPVTLEHYFQTAWAKKIYGIE